MICANASYSAGRNTAPIEQEQKHMTITKHIAIAALILTAASQVQAQTVVEDADGSGGFSLAELQVAYPEMTEELFLALDADASGEVSDEELAAGIEAELIAE